VILRNTARQASAGERLEVLKGLEGIDVAQRRAGTLLKLLHASSWLALFLFKLLENFFRIMANFAAILFGIGPR
jgi:hypothetical protein